MGRERLEANADHQLGRYAMVEEAVSRGERSRQALVQGRGDEPAAPERRRDLRDNRRRLPPIRAILCFAELECRERVRQRPEVQGKTAPSQAG